MHGRAPGNRGRGRPRRCWVTDICEWTRSTPSQAIRLAEKRDLGGVYMRKLAPARVSYTDDFLISYRVYIMTGSFHISLFEGTLHVDKVHVRFKIANITGRPISHRNGWSFRVYMIPLRDFVPEWNSRPGTTTGVIHTSITFCRGIM